MMEIGNSTHIFSAPTATRDAIDKLETLARQLAPFRLICVRHGQTEYNKNRQITGQSDVPLNEEGRAQARSLSITDMRKIKWVFASDLHRSVQTATIFLRYHATNYTIYTDSRLREICFGVYEGQSVDIFADVRDYDVHHVFTSGESYYLLFERLCTFLYDLLLMYEKQKETSDVLMFGHAGAWRIVRSLFTPMIEVRQVFETTFPNGAFEEYNSHDLKIPSFWTLRASKTTEQPDASP